MKKILLLIFFLVKTSYAIDINSCSILEQEGATYYLTSDILNSTTSYCINILANNVVLDCQGHIIDGNDIVFYGIIVSRSPASVANVTIKNCVLSDWYYANIYLDRASENTIINITSKSSSGSGIELYWSNYNIITNTRISNNKYGIEIANSDWNEINNSVIQNNNYGIYLVSSEFNLIYNNLFNNTNNVEFYGTTYQNYWNTTKQLGQRIYSPGDKIGGNYWTNSAGNGFSDTCTDSDKDGFCDSYYELSTSINRDYLPLSDEFFVGDTQSPKYSLNSTNSTLAGTAIKHSLFWQDNVNLSYAIFSLDNCVGSFKNISGMVLSGNQAWSNFTVIINSTVGCTIKWKVYANDTSNNWNTTIEYTFNTSQEVYCGDTYCNLQENCFNCPQDCSCPGSPGCCGSSCGCLEGQVCENDVCKVPSQPPTPPQPIPSPECSQDFIVLSEEKNVTLVVKCIDKNQTRNFTISKFPIFNLTFKTSSTIYNFIIRIKKIPEYLISSNLRLNRKVYSYFEFLSENLDEKLLQEIIVGFELEKSWIFPENVNISTINFYRFTTSWEKLKTYKINEDSSFVYFESEFPGFSLFAIAGEEIIIPPPPQCPVCPSSTDWSECIGGKKERRVYVCSEETNFTCTPYIQSQECEEEEKKKEGGFSPTYLIYLIIPISACGFLIVFLDFYLRKKAKMKEKKIVIEKEIFCPRCGAKMEKTYSGQNMDMYKCIQCGYYKVELKT